MKFKNRDAGIFIPDGILETEALERTTHIAVGAHQDDTEIFAYHGIAQCFGRKNRWFSSIIVTNGAGSPRSGIYKDFTDEQMLKIRKEEQKKAAVLGEYSVMAQLGYPSSSVKNPKCKDVSDDILAVLEKITAEVVYLHNPADKHDTHVAVFLRSIEALRQLPEDRKPQKVYGCEVWRDLDWLNDNEKIALPVSEYKNLAASLLGVFDSQISGGKRYDLSAMGRRLANATFYESHETDACDALTYAIDLTPLIQDVETPITDFISAAIERFKDDVRERIKKLS